MEHKKNVSTLRTDKTAASGTAGSLVSAFAVQPTLPSQHRDACRGD